MPSYVRGPVTRRRRNDLKGRIQYYARSSLQTVTQKHQTDRKSEPIAPGTREVMRTGGHSTESPMRVCAGWHWTAALKAEPVPRSCMS